MLGIRVSPRRLLAVALFAVLSALAIPEGQAVGITNAADDLRTGWYGDQYSLTPQLVASAEFARRFDVPIQGQVYAQPLVYKGSLIVATEANWIYRMDPENGTVFWSKSLGVPWNAGDIGCGDLTPTIGVTGTPVLDDTTETIYLVSKTYNSGTSGPAAYWMHALDLFTGRERANFPVKIQGAAQNNASASFNPTKQLQRPGLLLLDGVVYAGFGGHCDFTVWHGWVAGVSTSGVLKALWVTRSGNQNGAAIWQSGGGLVSDGPGRLFITTGNGGSPTTPIPGNTPPANLGNVVARLAVQGNGTLQAVDFFSPYNAGHLDAVDLDLASSAATGLPSQYFGTAGYPHLLVQAGKEGFVYLMNRDNLGGCQQGSGGSDNVIQRLGNYGGVWSRPSVWPGDGGWVYIVHSDNAFRAYQYGVDGTGKPKLTSAGTTAENFGFGTGAPVVTSSGTTGGSALIWVIKLTDTNGLNAQLRAYDAVPGAGVLNLRFSSTIGTATKFTPPGVGADRIYVGTRDGHLLAYGATAINLTVTKSATPGSVHLGWSGGNAPFILQRSPGAKFPSSTTLVDRQPATSYDDPVLADANSYFYLTQ